MERSETIGNLAAALAKAQAAFKPVLKTAVNPFYKSKYAPLGSIIDATREALAANELAILQLPEEGALITTLVHSSGEWISCTLPTMPTKDGPQAQGSAITYARRYALSALLGVASEDDDDAEQADTGKRDEKRHRKPAPSPESTPSPTPETSPPASYDAATVAAVIEAGLTANTYSFANTMKRINVPADADKATVLLAFRQWRESRDAGGTPDDAEAIVNAWWEGERPLYEALHYVTDKGTKLAKLSPDELLDMVMQIDGLEKPISQKMVEIRQHCLRLVEYGKQFEKKSETETETETPF